MGDGRLTPGFAFVLAGFGLLGVSAGIEASLVVSGDAAIVGGDLTRLAMVPWALGLVFFGHALDHPEVLWDRSKGRRALATYLLFADGGVHLLAVGEHVDLPVVGFFAVLAPLEFAGAWFLLRGSPRYLGAWLAGTVGLIALYAVTRATTIPFVDEQYRVEPLGVVSKLIELLFVAALAQELWTARRSVHGTRVQGPATQS